MSATIGYQELRAATVRQVAQLMAAAAITAPKSGGQLFLAGKPNFMETVIADDPATRRQLAAWMRARGKERRERIWFRDADAAEAVDAILFVGLLPGWYPPNYDCGACGYATCANSSRRPNPRERRRVNARRSRPPRTDTPHRTHDRGRCPAPDAHTAPILPSAEACKRRDRLVYRADQATTETSTCPRRHPGTAPARLARNGRTCRPTVLVRLVSRSDRTPARQCVQAPVSG